MAVQEVQPLPLVAKRPQRLDKQLSDLDVLSEASLIRLKLQVTSVTWSFTYWQ